MSPANKAFRYEDAFARNIAWVTEAEQPALRGKRVAIAGAGGVGGVHLLTLARLGMGAFTIADMDRLDLVNFNRQAGAMMSTLDRPKVDVMAEMARTPFFALPQAGARPGECCASHVCDAGRGNP